MANPEGFLGMIGTEAFDSDERPRNFRAGILRRYPNGTVPLTALTALAPSESVDDYQYNFFTKPLPDQSATPTGVYTNVALTSAYASGALEDAVLYIKCAEADVKHFVPNDEVRMGKVDDLMLDTVGRVIDVGVNGAGSFLAVKLLEADNNSSDNTLHGIDFVQCIGNINSENGEIPQPVSYRAVKKYNFLQTFRTSLGVSRRAKETKLRTEAAYKEAKRETAELHAIKMELAFLFGKATEKDSLNGVGKDTTTRGVITQIKEDNPENVSNFLAEYAAGTSWAQKGKIWLDTMFEQVFRVGDGEKLCFVGSGATLGLNQLAETYGTINLNPKATAFGIAVVEWVTPFGVLLLKRHPLLTRREADRHKMIILEPRHIKYRYMNNSDTQFLDKRGANGIDGEKSEFLTDAGLEYHFTDGSAVLDGVGKDIPEAA